MDSHLSEMNIGFESKPSGEYTLNQLNASFICQFMEQEFLSTIHALFIPPWEQLLLRDRILQIM
jgi:hypothetical protein